ncbi:MAG: cell division protein ZipA, partial [Gammaproteobacteria bacterium]
LEDTHLYADMKISPHSGREGEDYSSVLADLKPKQPEPETETDLAASLSLAREGGQEEAAPPEDILILHVMADPQTPFRGPPILTALREAGLVFGEMGIFHHYGPPGLRRGQPLFHLVNMVEPGNFDLDQMHTFTTPGLSLFLQLPSPMNAEVVLDLMLETARRLAVRLGGEVATHDRQPLTEEYVSGLREQINRREQA